jgi:NAD(P)-dependent dehydrogenase (short-subunit alcohol dehydrogenase family)
MDDRDGMLADRVVLVVGGTAGVGAGVARAAARAGAAAVVVSGRDAGRGRRIADELSGGVAEVGFVPGDIADPASARAMVSETVARHGRIDCLVNSAGLMSRGSLLDTTPALFDAHVATNLRGPFFTMQAAVEDMRGRGAGGSVVNIISSSESGGQPYLAPYVAAKAGLAGLTRNAAYAHRWHRIRINGLDIGWTQTDGEDAIQRRFHDAGDDWAERAGADLPMGRLAQVDEIAEVVVFLLSDRSGVVTGSVLDWDQNIKGCYD